jgi:hypothetical protein
MAVIFSLLANEARTKKKRGGKGRGKEGREGEREGEGGDWAPKPQPLVVLFFFLANTERS